MTDQEKDRPAVGGDSCQPQKPSSGHEAYQPGSFAWGVGAFPSKSAQQPDKTVSKAPFILAIVGLVLCFTGVLAFVGVACGIAALVLRYIQRKKTTKVSASMAPKATLVLSVCSIVLGILIMIGGAAAGGTHLDVQDSSAASVEQQVTKPAESHELSFVVEGNGDDSLPASVVVLVSGKQSDGTKVNDRHTAAVGKTYVLAYPEGNYSFSIDPSSLTVGDALYKAGNFNYFFNGTEDHTVCIGISQDTDAMQKAQANREAAEQKKAQEAAAAEQEAAAAVEREAAAAAAAIAEQEAAAAAGGGGSGGDTVYITNTGEKYHASGCQYLRKSKIPISRSDAIAQGYGACSKCNP